MKLNPPETAPRHNRFSDVILACFSDASFHFMCSAVWNAGAEKWLIAQRNRSHTSFETLFEDDRNLTGWLPMPQIDDEGNVTWPSTSPA